MSKQSQSQSLAERTTVHIPQTSSPNKAWFFFRNKYSGFPLYGLCNLPSLSLPFLSYPLPHGHGEKYQKLCWAYLIYCASGGLTQGPQRTQHLRRHLERRNLANRRRSQERPSLYPMKKQRREEKKTKRAGVGAFTDIWRALSRHMNETREE